MLEDNHQQCQKMGKQGDGSFGLKSLSLVILQVGDIEARGV